MVMMTVKKTTILFASFILTIFMTHAQVGIGNTNPEAKLDVSSETSGLLMPRVALSSRTDVTTVSIPSSNGLQTSTMVYNTGNGALKPAGFYYWDGSTWSRMITTSAQVHVGKFKITDSGELVVTGLPFQPKRIVFKAYANNFDINNNSDNGTFDQDNGLRNYFGYMSGFAQNNNGIIAQQVIASGGSASSIDDLSKYSSSTKCIGIRYSDADGNLLGLTNAALTSFNTDGFTINITKPESGTEFLGDLLVLYTAYKF